MESIVAKHGVDNVPIAAIGIEPALALNRSEKEGEDKLSCIAIAAYYKAEARGYEPGHEMQDWLDAESEIMKKTNKEKIK